MFNPNLVETAVLVRVLTILLTASVNEFILELISATDVVTK